MRGILTGSGGKLLDPSVADSVELFRHSAFAERRCCLSAIDRRLGGQHDQAEAVDITLLCKAAIETLWSHVQYRPHLVVNES